MSFRRAVTCALLGLGFCEGGTRFNALDLTKYGVALAESVLNNGAVRRRLCEWLQTGAADIQRVSDAMKKTLLPEFATVAAQRIVQTRLLADPSRSRPAIDRAMQLNPHVQSKAYAESGHAPFLEEADRFNRDLAAFVDVSR